MTDLSLKISQTVVWRRPLLNLRSSMLLVPLCTLGFLAVDVLIRQGRIAFFPWILLIPLLLFSAYILLGIPADAGGRADSRAGRLIQNGIAFLPVVPLLVLSLVEFRPYGFGRAINLLVAASLSYLVNVRISRNLPQAKPPNWLRALDVVRIGILVPGMLMANIFYVFYWMSVVNIMPIP